jgi:hypothetical protein
LHANLLDRLSGIGVNADAVASLIIRRRLVRHDVATHEEADRQVSGTKVEDRITRELGHFSSPRELRGWWRLVRL